MTPSYKAVTQNRLGTIEFQPNKLTENTLKWGEFPKSVFFFFLKKLIPSKTLMRGMMVLRYKHWNN